MTAFSVLQEIGELRKRLSVAEARLDKVDPPPPEEIDRAAEDLKRRKEEGLRVVAERKKEMLQASRELQQKAQTLIARAGKLKPPPGPVPNNAKR